MSPKTSDKTTATQARARKSRSKRLTHDNGKADRRTPEQLARQERVFTLNVIHGKTIRAIAATIGIDKETVRKDLLHESRRRQAENENRRDSEITRAIATYENFIAALLDKGTAHSIEAAIKARERLDKILGLEAPTKIDLGLQTLIDAIDPK